MGLWRSLEGFNCRVKPSVYLLAPRVGGLASKGSLRTTEQKSRRNQYCSFLQVVDCFPLSILVKWTWSTFKGCVIVMMKYLVHLMGSKTKSKFFFIIYAEITAIQHLYNTTVSKNVGVPQLLLEHVYISIWNGSCKVFFNIDLESIN